MSRARTPGPSPDALARDRTEALRLLGAIQVETGLRRTDTVIASEAKQSSSARWIASSASPPRNDGDPGDGGGRRAHSPPWLTPATLALLDRYVDLLLAWQARMNLVGPATLAHVWTRHIADSLQLLAHAPDAKVWVDLGSGAGFPGLVLACALKGQPQATVHLVESNSRKAAFLREVARSLDLSAEVHARRIEDFMATWAGQADVVTARALAPLPQLLAYAWPLLQRGAQGLFAKGQDVEAELTQATKSWNIRVQQLPSVTDPRGRILRIQPI